MDSPEPASSRTRIAAAELAGRGLAAATLLVGVFALGSTLVFCVAAHVPGPFADSWKAMEWLASAERGSLAVGDLFRPYGGHRVFFPALLFLLEYEYFRGTNVFLRGCGFALQLLSWLVLARFLWRDRATLSPPVAGFVAGLALALLFSGTQIMNFYSPWNLAHFAALAGVVVALAALIQAGSARTDGASGSSTATWTALAIAAATVSNYSLASGLLAWPVLLGIGFGLRLPGRMLWAIAGAGIVAGGAFFVGYESGLPLGGEPLVRSAFTGAAARFCVLMLGMPLSARYPFAGAAMGALGLASAAALLLHFVLTRRRVTSSEALLYGILAFAAGSAFLIAAGRHFYFSGQQWRFSRFQTNTLVFWLSLMSLAVIRLRSPATRRRACLLLQGAIVVWLGVILVPAQLTMAGSQVAASQRARDANLAIAVGIEDPRAQFGSRPGFLQWAHLVDEYTPMLLEQGWGMFAAGRHRLLGQRIGEDLPVALDRACEGAAGAVERFDAREALRGLRLSGWAWTLPERSPPELILVSDRRHVIVGLGHRARPEIWRPWRSEATTDSSRWVAFAHAPKRGARLLVWMELDDGSVCQLASTTLALPRRPRPGR